MHQPRKRFGQNFLISKEILQRIDDSLQIKKSDYVIEIGAGTGNLTQYLISHAKYLWAIEIDRDLIPYLKSKFQDADNFTLLAQDVLKVDWQALKDEAKNLLRIVGNLPYNISSPILFQLTQAKNLLQDIHVMLQREVADRICAQPGNKDYGRLSVMLQYDFRAEKHFDIPPSAFEPRPQVYSSWISLVPRYDLPTVDNEKFSLLVQTAFNQRRKTLRNSLKHLISAETFSQLEIDPQLRAENLTVEDYIKLSGCI